MASNLDKLEPLLAHTLETWRVRAASSKELAERQITVHVDYSGDEAELARVGMNAGPLRNGKVSGIIAMKDVERLAALPGVTHVRMQREARPLLDETIPEMRVPWKVPPGFSGKGQGVIVAVIDTGIDIFHESFRLPGNHTRILELWDQSASVGGSAPPAGTGGRIYSKADIEAALAAGEDAQPPFGSTDTNGHGTHVAGIAAGNGSQDDRCSFPGRYVGVAPEADLVIVKAIALPTGAASNTDAALTWCAAAGTRNAVAGVAKPVSINCSWGHNQGAHDGNDSDDNTINGILRPSGNPVPAGLAIVVSAGNEGQGYTHDSGTVPAAGQPGSTATISFYMPSNSTQSDPIEIWYDGAASFTVTLTAPVSTAWPGTNATPAFPPGPSTSFPIGGMSITLTSATAGFANHGNKKQILISIGIGTAPAGSGMRDGVWTITLTNTAAVPGNYDIWTQSSHTDGYPYFRLPGDPEESPARRRINTVGIPGNCRDAITVANYDGDHINPSSSRGPTSYPVGTPSGEMKPTVAGVGTSVTSARSRGSDAPSSCCDQKVIDMDGTSMSSPHVAGLVALIFQKNRNLTFEQARAHIQRAARHDGIPAGEVPVLVGNPLEGITWGSIWGAGKVNAQQTLADIPDAASAGGGGGGGGGGGTIYPAELDDARLGYTPHTIFSRLGQWRRRLGPRPGLMLVASLVSEHVDEILRLINRNHRVGAVWRGNGGPLLVRHLLYSIRPQPTLLPAQVPGCDVRSLIPSFLPMLMRFGSARLRADIERFGAFAQAWPGAEPSLLDEQALRLAVKA